MGRPLTVGQATAERKQSMINDGIVDLGSAWSSDKASGLLERRNILHNWDFRNPVNQRGQKEYESGFTIDRWRLWSNTRLNATVMDGLVRLAFARISDTSSFHQRSEHPEQYLGKTLALSVMAGGRIYSGTGALPLSFPNASAWPISFRIGGSMFQANVHLGNGGNIEVAIAARGDAQIGDYIDIQAVKLELGPVSTLANDPPMDYGRELAVCQRYQFSTGFPHWVHVPSAHATANQIAFNLHLPTTLRIVPTMTVLPGGGIKIRHGSNATVQPAFDVAVAHSSNAGVCLTAIRQNHGLASADLCLLGVLFDANL